MLHGLLFDYKWCTGCHACEIACQQLRGFAPEKVGEQGKRGIEPFEIGPYDLGNDRYQYEFVPVPTALCDHCANRVAAGKDPSCVKHCQTACISYGPVDELVKKMDSTHMALFV